MAEKAEQLTREEINRILSSLLVIIGGSVQLLLQPG